MKLSLLLLLTVPQAVLGANFIMFFTFISKSLRGMYLPVAEELVNRGHTVTIVTTFAAPKPKKGIKEIIIEPMAEMFDRISQDYGPGGEIEPFYNLGNIADFREYILNTSIYAFENKEVNDIINGKEKYDMAIVHLLFEDYSLGIVHKLGIPFIYVAPYGVPAEPTNNLRLPMCMSYCPVFMMNSFTNKMSFAERLSNTYSTIALMWMREYYFSSAVDQLLRIKLGPNTPPVLDIERNASLIILNDHFTLTYPRPLMPHMIEAAGMHCKPAKTPLPKELEEWIAGAGDAGFIYFSFGTVIPAHKIPEHFRKIIFEVLSKLPQRVIWKLDTPYANLPSNVKSFKWLPQQDILGDPRIRLFISHGGLLSLQETAYHGVPVLGIPVGIDQPYNLRKVEDSGTGIMLEWKDMTVDTFYNAIKKLTTDPNVKKNVKYRQAITKDLLNPPLEKAIYWIEYVLRYNGAEHLKSGGLYLKWYQYYQLDVWLFVITCIVLVILIIKKILKMLYRLIFKRATTHMKKD